MAPAFRTRPGKAADMDVELRHLRAFAAVATSRSSSRAAEQLFITQPALARTVRQLESLLGADLVAVITGASQGIGALRARRAQR
jgi:hypothetical protein